MTFEWGRMQNTPEGKLGRIQSRDRRDLNSLDSSAYSYANQAKDILDGQNGASAKDEIARFSKEILASEGPEQYEQLQRLVHALTLRKSAILGDVPDDEYEKAAFALALTEQYAKSLQ